MRPTGDAESFPLIPSSFPIALHTGKEPGERRSRIELELKTGNFLTEKRHAGARHEVISWRILYSHLSVGSFRCLNSDAMMRMRHTFSNQNRAAHFTWATSGCAAFLSRAGERRKTSRADDGNGHLYDKRYFSEKIP